MRSYLFSSLLMAVWLLLPVMVSAQVTPMSAQATNATQLIVDKTVTQILADFAAKKLESNQFAITLIDWTDPLQPTQGSYRGEVQIYPASVVKLFYMVAAFRQLEEGRLQDSPEFRRGMRDMIVDSANDATAYIVDLLTSTTSGPELPEAELKIWWEKRNEVNRYFSSLGYTNINVNKKPWSEGPYGREKQATIAFKPTRNWLTTDATAKLLSAIVNEKIVSPAACFQMKELLKRDFSKTSDNYQAHAFSASALPFNAKLWSKAGWTSDSRHDAIYVELPKGIKFTLVIFTDGHSNQHEIIPGIVRMVIMQLGSNHPTAK